MRKYYNNYIFLSGRVRELLLAEICRRENIIGMCNVEFMLDLKLEKVKGNNYQGSCPWCRQEKSFTLNSKTGQGQCAHCNEEGDYLDLRCHEEDKDLSAILDIVCMELQYGEEMKAEERSRERKIKREARMRAMKGGAA